MVSDAPFMKGIVLVFLEVSLAFVLEISVSFSSDGVVFVVLGRDTERFPVSCLLIVD